jgi:hypothetical protein
MSSVTLAESAKLCQDELIAGVIENVITVNRMYQVLPFAGIGGNALAYNRENVLGDVQVGGVGDSITAKNPATFTQVTSSLTSILGDAEVNGLIAATRNTEGNDQTQIQIMSKAKTAGRKYQDMFINGTGASNEFAGLISLCASAQKVDTGNNGGALSFAFLDSLISLVVDKDGQVDYFTMPVRTENSYLALLRALGGATISEVVTLPNGQTVHGYRGVPIFRNDYIPINQTKGGGSAQTTVFAGTFDDGTMLHGISGLTASESSGLQVEKVGIHQTKDETIWRVKWYCGLALFSQKGLAAAEGITN